MKRNSVSKVLLFCTIFFLLLHNPSCEDNNPDIPDVYVDFPIYILDPEFQELQIQFGYVYVKGGAYDNGIIVMRVGDYEFRTFDRTCPYDPEVGRVHVDKNWGFLAIDTLCGSQFLLNERSIVQGPATHYLKEYQTSYDPVNQMLYVFN